MILVRQLDRSVGKCTPALGLVLLEVTNMPQDRPCWWRRPGRAGAADQYSLWSRIAVPLTRTAVIWRREAARGS
jgi:hypothetical protein